MQRPRIGITTSFHDQEQHLSIEYVRAIEAAGGLPLIVPMLTTSAAAAEFAALLDGLVITGGPGITQGLIGELPADLAPVDPLRTTSDHLIYTALAEQPILGICYGMQFINAEAGGTIYADLMTQQPTAQPHSPKRGGSDHPVEFSTDSHLAALLGTSLHINTYHIQAVAEVGAGLRAVGYSPDGIIEALESDDGRLIGVQFHPERMGASTQPLFADFVARCRRS